MKALILFGTLTGNTEQVADHLYNDASAKYSSIEFELKDVNDITPADLNNYDIILWGVSTYGEGEINPAAIDFFDDLQAAEIDLSSKKNAIFALGESTYEHFCGAADVVEGILKSKGGSLIAPIHKIDGYPDDEILAGVVAWADGFLGSL